MNRQGAKISRPTEARVGGIEERIDLAVTAATYVDANDPVKGLRVMVENRDKLVLPSTLRVELTNGSHIDVAVPAETWMQNATHTFVVPVSGPATSATT